MTKGLSLKPGQERQKGQVEKGECNGNRELSLIYKQEFTLIYILLSINTG